tara:strand:- start:630 stop:1016 length:387 start_codon:yes stop_codon:yes gene_type:complete
LSGSRRDTLKSLKTRGRLHQVKRFLIAEYGVEVRLRVAKMPKEYKDCLGYISYDNPDLAPLIWIAHGLSTSEAVSTLLHEFAHAVSHNIHGPSWKRKYDGHDKSFAIVLNSIENRYLYDNGLEESKEY